MTETKRLNFGLSPEFRLTNHRGAHHCSLHNVITDRRWLATTVSDRHTLFTTTDNTCTAARLPPHAVNTTDGDWQQQFQTITLCLQRLTTPALQPACLLALLTWPTVIVNNSFRPSQSVYNDWQHLQCDNGRARFNNKQRWKTMVSQIAEAMATQHQSVWKTRPTSETKSLPAANSK